MSSMNEDFSPAIIQSPKFTINMQPAGRIATTTLTIRVLHRVFVVLVDQLVQRLIE